MEGAAVAEGCWTPLLVDGQLDTVRRYQKSEASVSGDKSALETMDLSLGASIFSTHEGISHLPELPGSDDSQLKAFPGFSSAQPVPLPAERAITHSLYVTYGLDCPSALRWMIGDLGSRPGLGSYAGAGNLVVADSAWHPEAPIAGSSQIDCACSAVA